MSHDSASTPATSATVKTVSSIAGRFGLMGELLRPILAITLVLVYVGAVMVLFLFVVMMLDVDFAELRAGFIKNAPLGAFVATGTTIFTVARTALRQATGMLVGAIIGRFPACRMPSCRRRCARGRTRSR